MSQSSLYIGIDVGTGSARAGVFDARGKRRGTAVYPIQTWRSDSDVVEQSSEDIWRACCRAVREALHEADGVSSDVRGVGFDATCSLVAVDERGAPVTVSPSGRDARNVIVWMDHRAAREAEEINESGHDVLRYVGGRISPEMQPPKLMWLKQNLPISWHRAAHFFDLPDYLTFRATGNTARSQCTTTCKWTYFSHLDSDDSPRSGWSSDFWTMIGLEEFPQEGFRRIGTRIRPMGEAVGHGLTADAARDMGLDPGTAVGISIIDAHAGGVGMLGLRGEDEIDTDVFNRRLALIGGTSSCHMVVSPEPRFIEGVWGPYYSAMVPGLWLNEGGQSASGALVDHVIFSHARANDLERTAIAAGRTVYEELNNIADRLGGDDPSGTPTDLHVLPYFHGNRSPRADATLRGMVSGLSLSDDVESLARLYVATVQAIAHGTRHIIAAMNNAGYRIESILTCGGGAKNALFLQTHADVTGCDVVLPKEPEAVLLGSAMLGAVAAGTHSNIAEAMRAMSSRGRVIRPRRGQIAAFHDAKHRVFHRMYDDQKAYRHLMNSEADTR